jgi:hypothetical protein
MDTMNTLINRLQTINIQKTVDFYREKLEEWRLDSHKKIDEFIQQKYQELNRLLADKIDEEREDINQFQSKIAKHIHEQQVTREDIYDLTSISDYLERQINNIEENFIEIYTYPLVLDNHLINIRGNNEQEYDLSILSSIYKTINRPDGSYRVIACNDRNLLIHQVPNLCLVNQDLEIFKRILWRYGVIYDISWSVTLDEFIVITEKNIFFVNENTMLIEKVKIPEKRKWLSCTCSDKFLFLSTNEWGSSITKISINPSKILNKQSQSSNICQIDEYIDVITYNKQKLAMIIKNNSNKTIRIELRSSETFDRVWSLPLDAVWNPNKPLRCCPFIDEDWLVADHDTGRLLLITKAGKMKSAVPYNTIPYYVTLFGTNILAVSAKCGINLHNLNYKKTYTICVL